MIMICCYEGKHRNDTVTR